MLRKNDFSEVKYPHIYPMMWIIWLLMLILPVFSETASDLQPEDYEIDLKDEFFRHLRSSDLSSKDLNYFQNLPKPGGFRSTEDNRRYIDDNQQYSDNARIRRSYHILPSPGLKSHFVLTSSDSKQKQRRIKRQTEEKKDIKPVEKLPKRSEKILAAEPSNEFEINDFIRFKRDDDAMSRLKRDQEIRKSLTMERDGTEREPRGATKEQWLKQPYPVERREEDNVPSASDNIRAPRVHFVTQRRPNSDSHQPPDNLPPPPPGPAFHSPTYPIFRPYDDRGARSRDFDPYVQPLPHNYPRPRSYDPYNSRYYDPYYDRFDGRRYAPDDFEPRYKYPEPDFRATLPPFAPVPNKQKRIIYYATLPEVVHTSPSADHRYTYQYQDSYDDRYMSVPPGSNAPAVPGSNSADTYRIRKSYGNQLQKHREYERPRIDRQKKTPLYPVKVSTDVNVRETKKTPERKIYSEANGNYNYKAESGNF